MAAGKPNVVFFFTDDQRFDTIAALGHPQISTPNMDRLVARGVTFTHAHIPCGTSPAVCMPSRAMLHTGRTLFHIEGAGETISPDHVMLGEHFRRNGYRTVGIGKWHNSHDSYARSFTDGAEIYFGGMSDHWNVPASDFDPTGRYDNLKPVCPNAFFQNTVHLQHCDRIRPGVHSSELFCDAAVDFLGSYDRAEPFLMYVSFLAPHDPRIMPERFLNMYDPAEIEMPPNFMPAHPFDNGELNMRDEVLAAMPREEGEIRRYIADYYAMISHLDYEIGRVLDELDARGLTDDTIIVFAGDNGLAVGQHGLMGKQSCYEHSVRVPLILAGPDIPQGETRDAYAYLLDIYPTLSDLCSLPAPDTVEGISLTGAIQSNDEKVRETLFAAYMGLHRMVKDRRYKLIEYVLDGRHTRTQLFDLHNDPWELTNLADDPDHAEHLARLRKELARWRDDWDDTSTHWGKQFWEGYGEA
ncbi:MAG: sulfatase-like hydrolase/transferase [Planctomycetota bacterium]|jgi:arylsulfatase A-like enzyme